VPNSELPDPEGNQGKGDLEHRLILEAPEVILVPMDMVVQDELTEAPIPSVQEQLSQQSQHGQFVGGWGWLSKSGGL